MYSLFAVLVLLMLSLETQCQRHIIGSRMLNFDNPVGFGPSPIRRERNSKDIKFSKSNQDNSNIRTVKDSTFDGPEQHLDSPIRNENNNNEFEECIPLDKCESLDWLVQNIDTVPNLSSSQIIETIKNRICGFYGRIPKVRCPIDDDNGIDDSDEFDEEYDYDDYDDDTSNGTSSVILEDQFGRDMPPKDDLFFGGSEDTFKNKTEPNNSKTVGNVLNGVGDALNGVSHQNSEDNPIDDTIYTDVQSRAIFKNIGAQQKKRCKGSLLIHHSASNGTPLEDFKQLRIRGKSYRRMRKLRDRNIVQMQTNGNCCWKIYSLTNFRGIEEKFYNGYNIVPRVHPKSIKGTVCS